MIIPSTTALTAGETSTMTRPSSPSHQSQQDPGQHNAVSQEQQPQQQERVVVISNSRRSSLTCTTTTTSRRRSSLASTSTYGDDSCVTNGDGGEEGSRRPRRRRNSSVTFGEVRVREHEIVLGNHPCCKTGFPIELGWKYYEQETVMRLEQTVEKNETKTHYYQHAGDDDDASSSSSSSSSGQRRGISNSNSISLLDFEEPGGRVPIVNKKVEQVDVGASSSKEEELVSLNVVVDHHRRPSSDATKLSSYRSSTKPKSSRRTTARRLSLEERMDLLQIGSNSNSHDVEEVMNQMDSIFAASRHKSRSSGSSSTRGSRSSSSSSSSTSRSTSRRPVLRRRSSDYLLTVNGTAA